MDNMTVRTFAQLCDVDERTVQRWLRDGRLPGAVKTNRGWVIPSTTVMPPGFGGTPPPPPPSGPASASALVAPVQPAAVQGGSLSEALATLPAFLPLEVAALLLGIPESGIRRNAEALGAVPYGQRGRLVVPARTVREIAGL